MVWSPPGTASDPNRWRLDIQRPKRGKGGTAWVPPGQNADRGNTQFHLPEGASPTSVPNWHMMVSPPGSPAPRGLPNWNPKSKTMSPPGMQAPVDEMNLTPVPAGAPGGVGAGQADSSTGPFGVGGTVQGSDIWGPAENVGLGQAEGAEGGGGGGQTYDPDQTPSPANPAPATAAPASSTQSTGPGGQGSQPVIDSDTGETVGEIAWEQKPDPDNPGHYTSQQVIHWKSGAAAPKNKTVNWKNPDGTHTIVTLGPDGSIANQETVGTPTTTPRKPVDVPRGGTLVDPNTGQPIYSNPPSTPAARVEKSTVTGADGQPHTEYTTFDAQGNRIGQYTDESPAATTTSAGPYRTVRDAKTGEVGVFNQQDGTYQVIQQGQYPEQFTQVGNQYGSYDPSTGKFTPLGTVEGQQTAVQAGNQIFAFDPTSGAIKPIQTVPQPLSIQDVSTPSGGRDIFGVDPYSGQATDIYHQPGEPRDMSHNIYLPSDWSGSYPTFDPAHPSQPGTAYHQGVAGAPASNFRQAPPAPTASAPTAVPPSTPLAPTPTFATPQAPGIAGTAEDTSIGPTPPGSHPITPALPGYRWTPPSTQFAQSDIPEGSSRGAPPPSDDQGPADTSDLGEGQAGPPPGLPMPGGMGAPPGQMPGGMGAPPQPSGQMPTPGQMPPPGGQMGGAPPQGAAGPPKWTPQDLQQALRLIAQALAQGGMQGAGGKPPVPPKPPMPPTPSPGGPQGVAGSPPMPAAPAGPTGTGQDMPPPSAPLSPLSGGVWRPPLDSNQVLGTGHKFGEPVSIEGVHKGVDLQAYRGTPAKSPVDGVVTNVQHNPKGLGITVTIRDAKGHEHTLGHLGSVAVKVGESVRAGQPVAQVGSTGASTGPHLDVREKAPNGAPVDVTSKLGPLAQMPRADNGSELDATPDVGGGQAWRMPVGAGQDVGVGGMRLASGKWSDALADTPENQAKYGSGSGYQGSAGYGATQYGVASSSGGGGGSSGGGGGGGGGSVVPNWYDQAYIQYLNQQISNQNQQAQASLQEQIQAENNRHQEAEQTLQEQQRHDQAIEGLQQQQQQLQAATERATAELQSGTQVGIANAQIAAQYGLQSEQFRQQLQLSSQQFQQNVATSALQNPWLQRLTGMLPGYGQPGGPGGSAWTPPTGGTTFGQILQNASNTSPLQGTVDQPAPQASMPSWDTGAFSGISGAFSGTQSPMPTWDVTAQRKASGVGAGQDAPPSGSTYIPYSQFSSWTPFQLAGWRTAEEAQGPGSFQNEQDYLLNQWGKQGITAPFDTSQLAWDTAGPTGQTQQAMLGEFFGNLPQWQQRQGTQWAKARQPNVSVTT